MILNMGTCTDEPIKINKSFSLGASYEGMLRDDSSVLTPSIMVEAGSSIVNYNYAYIPDFGRYYYVRDIVTFRQGLWIVSLEVDVLKTYASHIMGVHVILSDTQVTGKEQYMSGNPWKTLVKDKTDIISFSSGLNSTGEYILITAGG